MVLEQMEKACRKLIELDLSPPQFIILHQLGRQQRTMGELAEECNFSSAASTLAVDVLEKKGYVERIHSTLDRRKVMVNLTPTGKDKLKSAA